MSKTDRLIHDIMNELQAVSGFLELAPASPQVAKARGEMKEVFSKMRQLRKVIDASSSGV